ncbi:MAG TPA: hypothetical protein VK476_07665, partial [Flavobacterium sp.]|nr:hypothetical protein [Flavobacterium sp.]
EWALFFLNFDKNDGGRFGTEICDPCSEMAEDRFNFYGMQSFIFPFMDALSANEIAEARRQLFEPSGEFRKKIDQWAGICYENPDTNEGLDFFRQELLEFLPTMQAKVEESWILKNAGVSSHLSKQSQIIIGEAPIENIWAYYRDSAAISTEVYDDLMRLKKEQFPRFEGRWPVFIYQALGKELGDLSDQTDFGALVSVRKSISVD